MGINMPTVGSAQDGATGQTGGGEGKGLAAVNGVHYFLSGAGSK